MDSGEVMNSLKRNSNLFSTLSGAMDEGNGLAWGEAGDRKQVTGDYSALVAADEVSVSQAGKEVLELFLR